MEVVEFPFAKCVSMSVDLGDPMGVLSIVAEALEVDPSVGSVVDKLVCRCLDSARSFEDSVIEVSMDRVVTCVATCCTYVSGRRLLRVCACSFTKPVTTVSELFELFKRMLLPPPIYMDIESVIPSCREDSDCEVRRVTLNDIDAIEITIRRAPNCGGSAFKIKALLDVEEAYGASVARVLSADIRFE